MLSEIAIFELSKLALEPQASLKDSLRDMEQHGRGFSITTDGHSYGLITDGDLRRLILAGENLSSEAFPLSNQTPRKELLSNLTSELLATNLLRGLKVLFLTEKPNLQPTKVAFLHVTNNLDDTAILIMAGGKGTRLRPLTLETPKPLLKVGQQSIIRRIQEHALIFGIPECWVSINYLAEKFLQRKEELSVGFDGFYFIEEEQESGTGGALREITTNKAHLIVHNGDVISDVNFQELLNFHQSLNADATVVTKNLSWTNPYGVVVSKDNRLQSFAEKPTIEFEVNTGIYIFSMDKIRELVLEEFGVRGPLDVPEILERMKSRGLIVATFNHQGLWRDIGTIKSLEEARNEL